MADKLIRVSAYAAVALLALIAFSISFRHIYDLAIRIGEDPTTAQLYPVTVDGLLLTSGLVGFYCSRYRLPTPHLARVGLVMGIGATLACNLAHGLPHGLAAGIFAGWPAAALLVASEMVLWLVARSVDTSTVIVVDRPADQLSEVVALMGSERGISAAEIARRTGMPYPRALTLVKEAKALLP